MGTSIQNLTQASSHTEALCAYGNEEEHTKSKLSPSSQPRRIVDGVKRQSSHDLRKRL